MGKHWGSFLSHCITTDTDMKEQAVCYIEVDMADMWKSLAEYSDPDSSYEDWKKKVVGLYLGTNEDKRWTMKDLDKLIGERAWIGIYNLGDFGMYYQAFYTVSTFLLQKGRISPAEQSRLFC